MDVEKLVDRLKSDAADWNGDRYIKRDLLEAAEALEKLQAENESLKNKLHDSYQGHLLDVVIPRLEAELEKAKMARPIELTGKGAEAFALAAELSETKQELEKVKAERDAAVECIPHECKTCVYHTVFFNGCTLDHDCTNPDGGRSNNYDRWRWRGRTED